MIFFKFMIYINKFLIFLNNNIFLLFLFYKLNIGIVVIFYVKYYYRKELIE